MELKKGTMHYWLHHYPKTEEGEEACVVAYYKVS